MGNSNASGKHAASPASQHGYHQQSLPREGMPSGPPRGRAGPPGKHFNHGFKVLPERVPGQKLRLTDNGQVLQTGGTLSGRRILGSSEETSPPRHHELHHHQQYDANSELARAVKRRSDVIHESDREDHPPYHDANSSLRKKYHSNPDLLHSHGILSGHPSGGPIGGSSGGAAVETELSKKQWKKLMKKSRAPPPPPPSSLYYQVDHSVVNGHGGTTDAHISKKGFSHFLKSSPKKSDDNHSKLGPSNFGASSGVNSGEVTTAKIDSKSKSITYVLERQQQQPTLPVSKTPDGSHQQRYAKKAQSPDAAGTGPYHHPLLQSKLSDSVIQVHSIDRAEIRQHRNNSDNGNSSYDLQKRVRSMDSLACSSADDMDIYFSRNINKQPVDKYGKPLNGLHEPSKKNGVFNHHNPVARRPSNSSSSLLSDARRTPWDKSVGARHNKPMTPDSSNAAAVKNGPKDAKNPNKQPYYYSERCMTPNGDFPGVGSLDRRHPDSSAKILHQRTPSGTPLFNSARPDALPPPVGSDAIGTSFNQNLDLHAVQSKENMLLVGKGSGVVKDKGKYDKGYHSNDKVEISDHLQDAFFAKTKETRAGVTEYNRKLGIVNSKRPVTETSGITGGHHCNYSAADDDTSSEDEMDINMQLRPTLPKRLPALPRFSPTQVWRSFNLEDNIIAGDNKFSEHSGSEGEGEEADVFEDRIQRIARPIAPPRGNNEKSADSGISPGAVSPIPVNYDFDAVLVPEKNSSGDQQAQSSPSVPPPLQPLTAPTQTENLPSLEPPVMATAKEKKLMWTPEEDLASDFDGASGGDHVGAIHVGPMIPSEMVSAQPKLTSRKDMFSGLTKHPVGRHDTDSGVKIEFSDIIDHGRSTPSGKKIRSANAKQLNSKGGEAAPSTGQKYQSVRKLKRSLSGVLQGKGKTTTDEGASCGSPSGGPTSLDDNWSLSRSLPNSLHNGQEGDAMRKSAGSHHHHHHHHPHTQSRNGSPLKSSNLPRSESGPLYISRPEMDSKSFSDLEGHSFLRQRAQTASMSDLSAGSRYSRSGHIMYLPKYEAMQIINENGDPFLSERKAYSDLGARNPGRNDGSGCPQKRPKKFTYQSTVRQIERKQLEEKLSREVAIKEKLRAQEMDLVNKVEEEFQRKRDHEKATIRQQLRILSLEHSPRDGLTGHLDNTRSLPREYQMVSDDDVAETDGDERYHASLPPLVIPPEDYDMTLPRNKANVRVPTSYTKHGAPPKHQETSQNGSSGGFFSGIGKWMRRQQRIEKRPEEVTSRQEPEGAPASFGSSSFGSGPSGIHDGGRDPPPKLPPSPQQENRNIAITGAKFSSGRNPDGGYTGPLTNSSSPQQKKSIYTHLAEVAIKEENLKKHRNRNHHMERTSVWILPDNNYPGHSLGLNANSKQMIGPGHDFYQVPYDSLGNGSRNRNSSSVVGGHYSSGYNLDKEFDKSSYLGGVHDWRQTNGQQRHSIAIDPSKGGADQWNPTNGLRRNGPFHALTQSNGVDSNSWLGLSRGPETAEDSGLDYRRRYTEPQSLNSQQRSLSFSQLWDGNGAPTNGRKQDPNPKLQIPSVQPFNPNKMYRPVSFQAYSPNN